MNILLTGSGGFIGQHLLKYLQSSYNILAPRSYELDISDKKAVNKYLKDKHIDFIIHAASLGTLKNTPQSKEEIITKNLAMFENLSAYVKKNCKMLVIGSGAEYDKSRPLTKIKEESFGQSIPKDAYGYSKYLISKQIEKTQNICNLRVFGIYGKGEDSSRVITSIIKSNQNNTPIILKQNVRFDFLEISDFCNIVNYFIKKFPLEKFINITPNESIEIKEIAEYVNKISNYKSKIVIKEEGLNHEYTGNNDLLCQLIKGIQFTSYQEGIKKLYKELQNV